jgi:hypothetical protein
VIGAEGGKCAVHGVVGALVDPAHGANLVDPGAPWEIAQPQRSHEMYAGEDGCR